MAKRVDLNQRDVVSQLRDLGCSVRVMSDVGRGWTDIVVGWRGYNYLFEIKSEKGESTDAQIKFAEGWRGQYAVIRSAVEAVDYMVEKIRKEDAKWDM